MEYGKAVTNCNQQTRINKLYLHFENAIQRVLHKKRNTAASLDLEFPKLISFTNAMYINQNYNQIKIKIQNSRSFPL